MDHIKQIKYIIIILLLPFLIWGLWGRQTGGTYVLAHDMMMDSYQGNVLKIFSNNVEVNTKGAVHIHLSNVEKDLWPTIKIRDAVRRGTYNFGIIYLEDLGHEDPIFMMDSLPFLAQNYDQARALWEVTRSHIIKRLKSQGLVYLFSIPCEPQGLFMERTLKDARRVKGMKIRSYGAIVPEYLELLGFSPVRLPESQAYQTLSMGKIRGFFGGKNGAYKAQTPRYSPYYYGLKYSLPKYVLVMNEDAFAKMSTKNQQRVLMQAQTADIIAWRMSQTDDYRRKHFFKESPVPEWFREKSDEIAKEILHDWKLRARDTGARLLKQYRNNLRSQLLEEPALLKKKPL